MSRDLTKSFLEDICANPDDDAPRLIFADWLDDNGNEARAEFIRVQVERARLPWWDAKQVTLSLRERALFAENHQKWLEELPKLKGVVFGSFRRGFLASVTFSGFDVLRANANRCWSAAPIEHLSIRWPRRDDEIETIAPIPGLRTLSLSEQFVGRGDVGLLADAPLLSTLTTLEFRHCALGLDGFERILHSPHLAKLTALRAPFNSIGNGGITALYKAASLARLTELDLSETGSYGRYGEDPILDVVGMASLANWPGLANLRKLTLSGNDLKKGGLQALLLSPHVRNVKEMTVRDNGFKGASMDAFGSANPALQLDVLDIGENLLRDRGASGMKNAACLAELKVLRIDQCEMSAAGVRTLTNAPFVATLRRLDIGSNNIGSDGIVPLLDANPPHLYSLSLRNCELDDVAIEVLADSPDSDALLELDLSDNDLGDGSAVALAEADNLQQLCILRLHYHGFTEQGIKQLTESPLGQRLAVLELAEESETWDEDPGSEGIDIPF